MHLLALDFPPISHLTIWRDLGGGINKTVLIYFLGAILTILLFAVAGSKKQLVPTGVQALAESGIDFIREQVIMPTMGADGMGYLPFLTTMFFFILFTNLTEIVPFIQFPANARIAMPVVLALLVWVIFNVVGVVKQ